MSELLTVKDLEKFFKVSRQTIYEWRKQGMPFRKIGRSIRFDMAEVDAWVKSLNQEESGAK
jgi:excisionase family DNA binding protein